MIRLLLKTVSFNEIEEACSLGKRITEIFVQHRRILYAKLEAKADEVIAQQYSTVNAIDGRTKVAKGQAQTATRVLLQEMHDWTEDNRITVTQLLSMYLISIGKILSIAPTQQVTERHDNEFARDGPREGSCDEERNETFVTHEHQSLLEMMDPDMQTRDHDRPDTPELCQNTDSQKQTSHSEQSTK